MIKQINHCIVWCSHKDTVVRYLAVPPFGHIGYWGILTIDEDDRAYPKWKPYPHFALYNRETDYEHTNYFVPDTFSQIMKDIIYGPKKG